MTHQRYQVTRSPPGRQQPQPTSTHAIPTNRPTRGVPAARVGGGGGRSAGRGAPRAGRTASGARCPTARPPGPRPPPPARVGTLRQATASSSAAARGAGASTSVTSQASRCAARRRLAGALIAGVAAHGRSGPLLSVAWRSADPGGEADDPDLIVAAVIGGHRSWRRRASGPRRCRARPPSETDAVRPRSSPDSGRRSPGTADPRRRCGRPRPTPRPPG